MKLRAVTLGVAVALIPVVAAPLAWASDCPQLRCTADHAGSATTSMNALAVPQLKPVWAFKTAGRISASPSVAGDTTFVPSEDGNVYATATATGVQRWAFQTGGAVMSTPAVAANVAYFGSSDHAVYAVDVNTGKQRWRIVTKGEVTSSPAVAGGVVYVGSHDHSLYAIRASDGKVLWTFQTANRVSGSPAVGDGLVYVGSNDHHMYAVDAVTGHRRWSFEADAPIWSPPAIAGGRIFFTSYGSSGSAVSESHGGLLYAVDASTGQLAWTSSSNLNGFGAPVVVGDTVVASGFTGVIAADARTGAVKWSVAAADTVLTSPFVAGGVVYFFNSRGAGDGSLVALNLETGATLADVSYKRADSVTSGPVVVDDRVLFGSGDGLLHALSPGAGGESAVDALRPVPPALAYSGHRDILANMLDAGSVAEIRQPGDGVPHAATSGDPKGLNIDFTNFHGYTPDGRSILLDVDGAGTLTDLYMYANVGGATAGLGGPPYCQPDPGGVISPKIAFYVDDMSKPVFDMNAYDFYCGKAGFPFLAPLTGMVGGAQYSHVPVPFRKHLRVLADPAPGQNSFWYDFLYTLFPDDRGVPAYDPKADKARYQALLDRWGSLGQNPYPKRAETKTVRGTMSLLPGQTGKLLDVAGAGQVTSIRLLSFNSNPPVVTTPSNDPKHDSRAGEPLQATRIRAHWDGSSEAAIDAPVGDFFGTGFGQAQDFDTIVSGMHTSTKALPTGFPQPNELSTLGKPGGVSTYAFWPMPFGQHADITLTNTLPAGGAAVEVAYEAQYLPEDIREDSAGRLWRGATELGYFHASSYANRSEPGNSPFPERDVNDGVVRLTGRGNYAGHVLNMTIDGFGRVEDDLHFMEGDCMLWVDDAPDYRPNFTSTGHEECSDAAPYFQYDANNPTANVTNRDACGVTIFASCTDETSIFRWWVGDTISFQKRFEATYEHGSENNYAGSAAPGERVRQFGVGFYYLAADPPVVLPSAKTCQSRRHLRIRLRALKKRHVREVIVRVNGKRVAVRRGRRLTAPIVLRGLPTARFVVTVTLKYRHGKTSRQTRRYGACVPRGS